MEGDKTGAMIVYRTAFGEGRYRVEAVAVPCGRDVAMTIAGGTGHHIGAAVLAVPRPGLSDPTRISSSSSVLCVTGHKDDEPARRIASSLASSLNCIVTVSAGIHIDNASAEEIEILEQNISNLVNLLEEMMKRHHQRLNPSP